MAENKKTRVKIKLKNVRLSYAHLFKAKKFDEDDDKGKYQTRGIIDPDTKIGKINMDLIEDAIEEVIENKWGKRPKKLKDDKVFAGWADEDEDRPEMQDMYLISASNERRPLTIDRDGEDVVEADDILYSGMFADLILTVWTQDNKWGQRVNATLEGVKERGEGERLSGGAPTTRDDFEDDDDDDRGSRRGRSRGRDRDEGDDDDRGSRRGRGRDRDRDEEEDDGSSRRGRGRDRDDDEDDDRGSRRSRRGRDRDEEGEDDDRGSRRGRDRDDDDDDDRGRGRSRRGRDEEDEPKSSRRRRSRGDDAI